MQQRGLDKQKVFLSSLGPEPRKCRKAQLMEDTAKYDNTDLMICRTVRNHFLPTLTIALGALVHAYHLLDCAPSNVSTDYNMLYVHNHFQCPTIQQWYPIAFDQRVAGYFVSIVVRSTPHLVSLASRSTTKRVSLALLERATIPASRVAYCKS